MSRLCLGCSYHSHHLVKPNYIMCTCFTTNASERYPTDLRKCSASQKKEFLQRVDQHMNDCKDPVPTNLQSFNRFSIDATVSVPAIDPRCSILTGN